MSRYINPKKREIDKVKINNPVKRYLAALKKKATDQLARTNYRWKNTDANRRPEETHERDKLQGVFLVASDKVLV